MWGLFVLIGSLAGAYAGEPASAGPENEVAALEENMQQLGGQMEAVAREASRLQEDAAQATAKAAEEATTANEQLLNALREEVAPERIASELGRTLAWGAGDDPALRDDAVRLVLAHINQDGARRGQPRGDGATQRVEEKLGRERMARLEEFTRKKVQDVQRRSAEGSAEIRRVSDRLREQMRDLEQRLARQNAQFQERIRSMREAQEKLLRELEQRQQRLSQDSSSRRSAVADEYRKHAEELEREVRDHQHRALSPEIRQRVQDSYLDHAKLAREAYRLAERQVDDAKRAAEQSAVEREHARKEHEEAVKRLVRDQGERAFEQGRQTLNEATRRAAVLKEKVAKEKQADKERVTTKQKAESAARDGQVERTQQRIERLEQELEQLRDRLKELKGSDSSSRKQQSLHI